MAGYGMPNAGYPPQYSYPSAACSPPLHYSPYPPPQPDQTYYYGSASGDNSRCTFFQCMFICSLTIFAVLVLIGFNFSISFHPQLPDFSVTDVTVSGFNFSGNQLSAVWDVNFTVSNINEKLGVGYDVVKAAIFYGQEILAVTSLPSFYQEMQTTITVPVHVATDATLQSDLESSHLKSALSDGTVNVDIHLVFDLDFMSRKWTSQLRNVRFFCDHAEIDWPPSGSNPAVGRLNSAVRCVSYHCV